MLTFLYAISSGVLVGIGGFANMNSQNSLAGAVLFCVALYAILALELPLYTGRIGYVLTPEGYSPLQLLVILCGNFAGAFLMGMAFTSLGGGLKDAAEYGLNKLSQTPFETILRGIFCGMLMYVAAESWKRVSGPERALGILLAVPVFIVAGFEHCIADMFYFGALLIKSGSIPVTALPFMLYATLGNTLGAVILRLASPVRKPAANA